MSYCLNINCTQRENQDQAEICQNCGSKLLLKNRYRSLKKIGQGGFGQTFLAIDQDLPSQPFCVIKQLIPINDPVNLTKAKELFDQEGLQLDKLGKHSQIPELLAYFEQDQQLYLIQEYIEGENLKQILNKNGSFDDFEIIYLLKDLLPVIQFIHDHYVIHRDLKPENIINSVKSINQIKLKENTEEIRALNQHFLVDFGAAKLAKGTALFKTGTMIGTPQYVAPEQSLGKAIFSSDLYSLGVSCLHLLTNIEPFELFDISSHQWAWQDYLTAPINQDLIKILNKMIVMGTQYRYQSANQILADLTNLKSTLYIIPQKQVKSQENNFINHQKIAYPLKEIQLGNKWGFQDSLGQVVTITLFDEVKPFKDNFAPVRIGDQWGFINLEGKLVIPPKFDKIFPFKRGMAKVKINNKYGFINQDRQIFIPVNFDEIKDFTENLAPVKINQKWGFINLNGKLIIPIQFDDALNFSEGLAGVKIGDQYGYINTQGILVIPPQFFLVKSFLNKMAWVEQNNQVFFINPQGKTIAKINQKTINFREKLAVIKVNQLYGYLNQNYGLIIIPQYQEARNFHEKLAGVKINNLWGFINQKNQIIIKPQFEEIGNFSEGKARIKINNLWGYIDQTGKIIINAQFTETNDFKNGKTLVKLEHKYFYINSQGETVSLQFDHIILIKENLAKVTVNKQVGYINNQGEIISLLFDEISEFSEGLARVKLNNKYGYLNQDGIIVIPLNFAQAGNFKEGLARVKTIKKFINFLPIFSQWGYINTKGEIVIKPQFDHVLDFGEGLAGIKRENQWGFINKKGQIIIKPQFEEVGLFSEGLAYVKINKKYGYINQKGKIVIEPQFDQVENFKKGQARVKINKWLAKIPFTKTWQIIDQSGKIIN